MPDTATIANITQEQFVITTTYGNFIVPGKQNGEEAALYHVGSRTMVMDLGDKRRAELILTAREVAEEIARQVNNNAGEGSFLGVFVCAGDRPTAEEIAAAKKDLDRFDEWVCGMAEIEWGRFKNPLFISDLMRRAAKRRGLNRDWCYSPEKYVDCPACGQRILPHVAVCRSCGAVLDRERATKFGLVPPEKAKKAKKAS